MMEVRVLIVKRTGGSRGERGTRRRPPGAGSGGSTSLAPYRSYYHFRRDKIYNESYIFIE